MKFHDQTLFDTTVPVTSILAASGGRRAVLFSRGKLQVLRFDGGTPMLEREIAIDDDAAEPRAVGDTVAWERLSKGDVRAVDLETQVVGDAPAGWEAFAGAPLFLGAASGLAGRVQSRGVRGTASPDLAWLAVTLHRPDTDALFATSSSEEAKALAKGVRVLALTNQHVLVGTKKGTWQLLATGTWKKVAEGPLPGDPYRIATASPGGRWFAVSPSRPIAVTIIDARSGAIVGEHPIDGKLAQLAWVDRDAVAYRRTDAAMDTHLGLLRVSLPDEDDSITAAPAPTKKAKAAAAKPTRSGALGLPFELAWSTPETELKKLLKGQHASVNDQDSADVEAMIVEPTWRKEVYLPPPIAHAAALLLRNPQAPVPMDEALAKHLDDPHLQAVRPLLGIGGKRRLATIRAIAGHALSDEEKRDVTADAVTVWARGTSRRLPLSNPSLTGDSPYARLVEIVERHGDPSALPAELRALWTEGLAKTLDHLEAELATDFATFAPAVLANPKLALAAFEQRHASPRFATDAPHAVRALIEPIAEAPPPRDWDAQVAARAALAYGVLVLAHAGEPLPDVTTRVLDGRMMSPLLARAGVALGAQTAPGAPEFPAWVAALAGDWDQVPVRFAEATQGRVFDPDLAVLARYAATRVPDDRAEALALGLRGLGWGADRAAFSILFRLRDAGRLRESAAWFDYAPRTGQPYNVNEELRRGLRACSPELQRGVVERWLATGTNLVAAGDFEPERAITTAIVRADVGALRSLANEERKALVQQLLEQHIAASASAEAVLQDVRYSVPQEVYARLEQLAKRDETPFQRLQRLVAAAPGPKRELVYLVEHRLLADKGLAGHGTPARSRVHLFDADDESNILSVHLDDCPELKQRFPGAGSISVFAKNGKPSRVPTRVVANAAGSAEHQVLEAAPANESFALHVLRLLLPEGILGRPGIGGGTNDLTDHRVIADLLPYAAFVLDPTYAFVSGEQPILTVTDATVIRGGEGDEGCLLVFANGKSYCEYEGSGW